MFDSAGVLIAKKHDDIIAAHRKIIEVIEDNDWNEITLMRPSLWKGLLQV